MYDFSFCFFLFLSLLARSVSHAFFPQMEIPCYKGVRGVVPWLILKENGEVFVDVADVRAAADLGKPKEVRRYFERAHLEPVMRSDFPAHLLVTDAKGPNGHVPTFVPLASLVRVMHKHVKEMEALTSRAMMLLVPWC